MKFRRQDQARARRAYSGHTDCLLSKRERRAASKIRRRADREAVREGAGE